MISCASPPGAGIVTGLIATVDCYIEDFAQGTYRDLVGPGTTFAAAFTVLLTVYIAAMGYQLLIGRGGLRLTDLPVTSLKVGIIFAFLTSWAAYQMLVYQFLFHGPEQIGAVMLSQASRLGGSMSADVYGALEKSFYALTDAAAVYGRQAGGNVNILQGGPALGSGLLWFSAVAMLLASIGLILSAKIVLGFLLALGPVFIGLFLFDATRGFFDGWLRTTVGFALTPLAAAVLSAAMLLLLNPFLDQVTKLAAQNRFDMGAVVTIAIIVSVFVIVMLQSLRLAFGIAGGFRRDSTRTADNTATAYARAVAAPKSEAAAAEREALSLAIAGYASRAAEPPPERRIHQLAEAVTEPGISGPHLGEIFRPRPMPTEHRDRRM